MVKKREANDRTYLEREVGGKKTNRLPRFVEELAMSARASRQKKLWAPTPRLSVQSIIAPAPGNVYTFVYRSPAYWIKNRTGRIEICGRENLKKERCTDYFGDVFRLCHGHFTSLFRYPGSVLISCQLTPNVIYHKLENRPFRFGVVDAIAIKCVFELSFSFERLKRTIARATLPNSDFAKYEFLGKFFLLCFICFCFQGMINS